MLILLKYLTLLSVRPLGKSVQSQNSRRIAMTVAHALHYIIGAHEQLLVLNK